jgi:hypothetical protein
VHIIDVVVVCLVVVLLICLAMILSRQRYLLRSAGAFPLAMWRRHRWVYGIARYVGAELRWYRSLGFATRPTMVLRRAELEVLSRRAPVETELPSVPATAVIVACRVGSTEVVLALGGSAFTGFTSWLEASAPLT